MAGRACRCALATLLLFACGAPDTAPPPGTTLTGLLPTPAEIPGWQIAEGPISYLPDGLYEYLDGGAERYVTSGFRELAHVRFQHGDDPLAGVTLDIYDMGGDLGAFGMFRSALPSSADSRDWCTEGYSSGLLAAAWKGRYYVRGEADEEVPELVAVRDELMSRACERIPGEESLPAVLDVLPTEGRVPGSERWVASNLLGHAFLGAGVLASYSVGDGEAQLFSSDSGSEQAAADAVRRLLEHHAERGEIVGEIESAGADGFRYADPTLGNGIIVSAGSFVAGVHGDLPFEDLERLLVSLVERLESHREGANRQ